MTYHDDIHVSANHHDDEPASHGEVAATAASAGDRDDSEPVDTGGGTCHRDRDTVTRASG